MTENPEDEKKKKLKVKDQLPFQPDMNLVDFPILRGPIREDFILFL